MPLLFGILVSAGVIFAIFAVTLGRGGSMTQFQPDWPGQPLPQDRPVRASDLADAKFSVAFRGYRMAEVDEALDRLAVEIAQRDERLQQLTGQPFDADPPAVTVVPAAGEVIPYDPAAYRPDDTAIYQPSAPYDPNAPSPYAYEFNPYDPGASDPSVYQQPQPDPAPPAAQPAPAPPAEPRPYEPHGYPPGVLDVGGHPTQPIPPVPDPDQRTTDQRTEG